MRQNFKSGLIYTAIGQYSNVLIQLVINMVLSRLLSVEEFGVVAIVQVFLVFFQMLVTAGIGPAIIQNKTLTQRDLGIIFNYTCLGAIALAIVFGFSGNLVAALYQKPIYHQLFWAMSVIVFAEGLNVVPTAILNKELRFKALNLRLFICNIVGAIAGIIAALCHLGVYALIISVAVPAVLTLLINFAIVKIERTSSLEWRVMREIGKFAYNQFGFTLVNYFSRNLDNILIGRLMGAVPLANYQKSYQLITMPNTVFLGIISPVMQPVLAKHQDNVELIRTTFFSILKTLAYLAFPITAYMILNADAVILFLFGKNWVSAIVPLQILAGSIWAQMLTSATGSIFMARNHSRTLFRTGILSTVIILTCTVVGVWTHQLALVAAFVSVAYCLNFVTTYWILMCKVLEGTFSSVVLLLSKPFLTGVLTAVVIGLFNQFTAISSSFLQLMCTGILLLLVLIGSLYIFGDLDKLTSLRKKETK